MSHWIVKTWNLVSKKKKKCWKYYMGPSIKPAMKSKASRSRSNYSPLLCHWDIYEYIPQDSKGDTSRLLKCGHQHIRFLLVLNEHMVIAILDAKFNGVGNTNVVVSNEVTNFCRLWFKCQYLSISLVLEMVESVIYSPIIEVVTHYMSLPLHRDKEAC